MGNKRCTPSEFVDLWNRHSGSTGAVARELSVDERAVRRRRLRLEAQGFFMQHSAVGPQWAYRRRNTFEFDSGVVIVYSDAHYWPGSSPTPSFRALVRLCRELKPVAIVANGDLIDGARISRFSPSGWARLPSMKAELDEMQARQAEIRDASPLSQRFRTVGNHDLRLDRHFVQNSEQFEGLPGTRLSDFLPDWHESWSVRINDTIIKHRLRGGKYAVANNLVEAGMSIVTGHLHCLKSWPMRGYRDVPIWGVETGTLAQHPAELPEEGAGPFEYLEDGPTHWACGFAVLTYHRGALMPPELCQVIGGQAWFRGMQV